ncbi:MAG: sulfatase-like hydrolase/transferase, partial [Planctomycetaceae bacterium]|nr:sulfatase-like hydrolase/transferase [Planctomycetaceae bacterium]
AMCENIDWNVGRVLAELDRLQLAENTIVVYFNDNGPNSARWNGGMKGRKGSTDEGGVRSPLVIRWPAGIRAGQLIEPIAGAIDLLPTLTDLAGIPRLPGPQLDGRSLRPLLTEQQPDWPDRVIVSHWNRKVSARNQRFRLDNTGVLFDMQHDPGQSRDVTADFPAVATELTAAVENYRRDVLADYPNQERPFTLTHPDSRITQMPARDAVTTGGIQRSNKFPNCSYFTNWTSLDEQISWEVEVLQGGEYEVELHYACAAADVGATIELAFGDGAVTARIDHPVESPLIGAAEDRTLRSESYVRNFGRMTLGTMTLKPGTGQLTLRATEIPGAQVMDFRMLMFRRRD